MYFPLELFKDNGFCEPAKEFEKIKSELSGALGLNFDDVTEDDLVHFFMSDNFLNSKYEGRFKELNEYFIKQSPAMLSLLHIPKDVIQRGGINQLRTEWKDGTLYWLLLGKWERSKQIYKPDPELCDALVHTKDLMLHKSMIEHLPVKTFMIDLADCPKFQPIVVILMHVEKVDDLFYSTVYMLTKEREVFSTYDVIHFGDEEVVNLKEYCKDSKPLAFNSDNDEYFVTDIMCNQTKKYDYTYNRVTNTLFCIQLLNYMLTVKPDIVESENSKKYHKSGIQRVRNRVAEVQEWKVGYRFGNTIRGQIKQAAEKEIDENREVQHLGKPRRSPIPHFRCAHFQHFWIGKGRTEKVLKWIEPVFVGLSYIDDKAMIQGDLVVHRVK